MRALKLVFDSSFSLGFAKRSTIMALTALAVVALGGCSLGSERTSAIEAKGARSFSPRQIRYMTPFDLMQTLKRTFPSEASDVELDCRELTEANRGIIGDSSASTGSPVFSEPNEGFVRWYVNCVAQYIARVKIEVSSGKTTAKTTYYGPTLERAIEDNPDLFTVPFAKLDLAMQKQAVREQIERMIGPDEVVVDFGYFESVDALAEHVLTALPNPNAIVIDAVEQIHAQIAIRDEFLSY